MDAMQVLAKTAKGVDEVRTRASGLPQKLRTLLILVDGQKTVGDVLARLGGMDEMAASLGALVEQGFVAALAPSGDAGLTPQGAAAARASAQRQEGYAEAVSGLCRLLHEYLGPDADSFTGPLENSATREEFIKASERAEQIVRGLAGVKKAERVAERSAFILARFLPG